jgi:hypothetical protein
MTENRIGMRILLGALLAASLGAFVGAQETKDRPEGATSALDSLWVDLATSEEDRVFHAVLKLSATPKETVAFLKTHLVPVKADAKHVNQLIEDLDSKQFDTRKKAEESLQYLGRFASPYLRKALEAKPSLDVSKRIEALLEKMPYDPMSEVAVLYAKLEENPKDVETRRKLIKALAEFRDALKLELPEGKTNANGATVATVVRFPEDPKAKMNQPAKRLTGPSPQWVRAKRAVAVLEHIGTAEAREVLKGLADGEPEALPTKEARAALERLGKKTPASP